MCRQKVHKIKLTIRSSIKLTQCSFKKNFFLSDKRAHTSPKEPEHWIYLNPQMVNSHPSINAQTYADACAEMCRYTQTPADI